MAAILPPSVPNAAAQAPPAGSSIVDFYLAKSGLDTTPPAKDVSEKRSILSAVATPGLGFIVEWGRIKIPHDLFFVSNGVVTVWLTSDNTALYTSMNVYIYRGSTQLFSQGSGINPDTGSGAGNIITSTEAQKAEFAIPLGGTSWKAGDELGLRFAFFGVGAGGTPADVYILYGSTKHPSRLSAAVDNLGTFPTISSTKTIYLAEAKTLSLNAPTDEKDKMRETENAGPVALGSASAWSWGKFKTTEDMVLAGDSYVVGWVTMQGTAAAMRGLRVTVAFGSTAPNQAIGVVANSYQSVSGAPSVTRFLVPLNTAGLQIPAGTDIDIRFQMWSSSDANSGKMFFTYGSKGRPAGLTLQVVGASAPAPDLPTIELPQVTLSSEATQASAAPGETAAFVLSVANGAAQDVNVTLSASSDTTVSFEGGDVVTVPAGATQAVNLAAQVPEDAAAGSSLSFVVTASVEGSAVANLTFLIDVIEKAKEEAKEAGETATNQTEGARLLEDEAVGIPGWTLPTILAAIAAGVWLTRRRPN